MVRLKAVGTVIDALQKSERLGYLTAVEVLVICTRYGFNNVPLSQAQTARCLRIKKTRCQDIEKRALRKILAAQQVPEEVWTAWKR